MKLYIVIAVIMSASLAKGADYMASCEIKEDSGDPSQKVKGTVMFSQPANGGDVTIKVSLMGFTADGKRGFHVHKTANLGNQCKSAEGHYNPKNVNHGGPMDSVRHVGDLGNINVTAGKVEVTFTDKVISLRGADGNRRIIGKTIVVHAGEDDLGKKGDEGSRTTGNAGARLGCCIIMDTTNKAPAHPPLIPPYYAPRKELLEALQAETNKLIAEKEKLMVEKEKVQLEINLLRRRFNY